MIYLETPMSKYQTCRCCHSRENVLEVMFNSEVTGTAVSLCDKCRQELAKLVNVPMEPWQKDAVWLCMNCEKEAVGWEDDVTGESIRYPFCRQCGQAVKWE